MSEPESEVGGNGAAAGPERYFLGETFMVNTPTRDMAQQQAVLHEIASQARDRGLERPIPSLLTYCIRWALDVSLPLDVLAVEKLANHHAMQILAKCRAHGASRLPASVWRELRTHLPMVWSILHYERNPF